MIFTITLLILMYLIFIKYKTYTKLEVIGFKNTIIELDNVNVSKLFYKCTENKLIYKNSHIQDFKPIKTRIISNHPVYLHDYVKNKYILSGVNLIRLNPGDEVTITETPGKKDIGDVVISCY